MYQKHCGLYAKRCWERRRNNEKEFSTNDHIHPDSGKDTHNQSSQENGTWNDHQLEQLFGEALGDTPTADETRKAWQTFIRRHRIRHQSIRRIMILGIAAAVIALALVFQPLLQPEQQEVEVFTSLEVPEEITFRKEGKRIIVSTPPATITSVQLSDGSKVLLSANSRLEYQKEFTDTIRSVKLSGEARFEVAKDASRPFIVCTEQLQTRVLGTVFDVKAYPRYSPDVILYQGRVNVSHTKRNQSKEMHPGEQISLDKQGKLQLKRVDTEKRKGWAENKFSFDNTDLRQVMQEIGSWYNISIVFRSRPLLDERIYFHINRQLPMNTVLDVLNDLKIAQFTMKEGKIIVETPQDKKR
ncbi:FecR domain-containing protein [Phocaeicola dorei]|nr:FecR domain-containing protein [Phocaeicola dorei]